MIQISMSLQALNGMKTVMGMGTALHLFGLVCSLQVLRLRVVTVTIQSLLCIQGHQRLVIVWMMT